MTAHTTGYMSIGYSDDEEMVGIHTHTHTHPHPHTHPYTHTHTVLTMYVVYTHPYISYILKCIYSI